jgi:hypothetical protein
MNAPRAPSLTFQSILLANLILTATLAHTSHSFPLSFSPSCETLANGTTRHLRILQ